MMTVWFDTFLIHFLTWIILQIYAHTFLKQTVNYRNTMLFISVPVIALGTIIDFVSTSPIVRITILSSAYLIAVFLLYEGHPFSRLFVGLSFSSLNFLLGLILSDTLAILLKKEAGLPGNNTFSSSPLLIFLTYYIICLLFELLHRIFSLSMLRVAAPGKWLIFLLFPVGSLLLVIILLRTAPEKRSLPQMILFFLFHCFFYYLIIQLLSYDRSLAAREIALVEYQGELSRYRENARHIEIIRRRNHEVKNQFLYLKNLLDNGKYTHASEYLAQISDEPPLSLVSVTTNHPVFDAILQQKFSIAKSHGIEVISKLPNLSEFPLSEDEIVVLISNLLDNCIEACLGLATRKKEIRFGIRHLPSEWIITTINPTELPPVYENGNAIQTLKENRELHGVGLINIKKIITSHGGDDFTVYENDCFKHFVTVPAKNHSKDQS